MINNYNTLVETFVNQQIKWLVADLRPGTVAIDIGANIGDTVIYLAMQDKITKVYAYEPFPFVYAQMVENIKRANYGDKVEMFNAGVLDKDAEYRIEENLNIELSQHLKDYKKGKIIPVLGINRILKNKKNVIIKCIATGSEHQIFNRNINLKNVYRIQIRYRRSYQDIVDVLKSKGFVVKREKDEDTIRFGEVGWIYAYKN